MRGHPETCRSRGSGSLAVQLAAAATAAAAAAAAASTNGLSACCCVRFPVRIGDLRRRRCFCSLPAYCCCLPFSPFSPQTSTTIAVR